MNVEVLALVVIVIAVAAVVLAVQPLVLAQALDRLARLTPARLAGILQLYVRWRTRAAPRPAPQPQLRRLLWKWLAQMIAFAAALTAIMLGTEALERAIAPLWPELLFWEDISSSIVWLLALLLTVPLLVALLAKLKACSIALAELRVADTEASEQVPSIRAVVAGLVMSAGTLALAAWATVICFAVAAWPVRGAFLAILGVITASSWRSLSRFYRRPGSEVRGQKSEVRGQKSEVRGQRSEVKGQNLGGNDQESGGHSPNRD